MVRCADNTIYTGITNNLPLRLQRHNHGTGAGYTRGRRPVVLVYVEPSADRAAASRREHSIKRLKSVAETAPDRTAGNAAFRPPTTPRPAAHPGARRR